MISISDCINPHRIQVVLLLSWYVWVGRSVFLTGMSGSRISSRLPQPKCRGAETVDLHSRIRLVLLAGNRAGAHGRRTAFGPKRIDQPEVGVSSSLPGVQTMLIPCCFGRVCNNVWWRRASSEDRVSGAAALLSPAAFARYESFAQDSGREDAVTTKLLFA